MSGTPRPDPAVLYPEVAAHGSLVAALRAAAGGGLDAVPLHASDIEPLFHAGAASAVPYREPLKIEAWRHERRWHIRGEDSFQFGALLKGETDDLAQLARAVRGWHDGESPEEIRRAAPFARPTGRFEVPDRDPGRLTESEWRCLLWEAAGLEYPWAPAYLSLIEAAYAQPALRALYPFTSHWALRFSTATRPYMSVVGPSLVALGPGEFGLGSGVVACDLGEFASAGEAVAAALARLPPGLGPVVLGTTPTR
ncbi:DUF6193 family natural product biosynthesis protein [Streptomyces sp. NBC_00525]|uniref:DUF6193 family natural product biosynthesis protein n=1 Tax=Streptomyces sp. NBC_00525 TaxID=2903660 RepID=UPI002E815613|nr:DUF6193 family natural product biosynthesis protein [Streptomyces sp. NBC_00525]WUC92798.1 DUF6193 family natural product biosynthesis protein [Streptomyces sp. NBC_00525]